ncbi:MAG: hypothetical protein JJE25_13255, partial [Bacteroidia bacterium]|nr:hypothetical protein [Bacteroidia bacterium]
MAKKILYLLGAGASHAEEFGFYSITVSEAHFLPVLTREDAAPKELQT